MMKTTNKDVGELENDYTFSFDPFSQTIRTDKLKLILQGMDGADRRIIIAYSELRAIRKVAQVLNMSYFPVWQRIDAIKRYIREKMALPYEELLTKSRIKCF